MDQCDRVHPLLSKTQISKPLTSKHEAFRLKKHEERDDVVWSPEEEINDRHSQEESDDAVPFF